eukprot:UN25944
MTKHRKVIRKNVFRRFRNIILTKKLLKLIMVINRINSRPIWTRTNEELYH